MSLYDIINTPIWHKCMNDPLLRFNFEQLIKIWNTETCKIFDKATNNLKSKGICLYNSCNLITQQYCHLLQKNRFLNTISTNGEVLQIKLNSAFQWTPENKTFELKLTSINHAFSNRLFCSNHDTNIFESIENKPPDFNIYRHQILLSYRIFSNEYKNANLNIKKAISEKEDIGQLYKWMISPQCINENNYIFKYIHDHHINSKNIYNPNFQILDKLKIDFESNIQNNNNIDFNFIYKETNKLPIAICSLISCEEYWEKIIDTNYPICLAVIPSNTKTMILMGYHKKYSNKYIKTYIEAWEKYDNYKVATEITRLWLTGRVSNWCISPNFWNNLDAEIKNYVKEAIFYGNNYKNKNLNSFNIFDNIHIKHETP